MSNESKRTLEWFKAIGANDKNTLARQRNAQLACFFEEVGELADALAECETFADSSELRDYFKTSDKEHLSHRNVESIIDALGDIQVTLIGVAYRFGFDINKILSPINDSNYSKFIDGKPVFNENGKVIKGKNYFKPDLSAIDSFKLDV